MNAPPSPPSNARPSLAPWPLTFTVYALAFYSVASWQFQRWVDLRILGHSLEIAFLLLWVASLIGLPFAQRATDRRAPAVRRWLMLPTSLLLGCLAGNTLYYYWLWLHDRIDHWPVPASLLAGLVLLAWRLTATRGRGAPTTPAGPRRSILRTLVAGVYAAGVLAVGAWLSLFAFRSNPPPAGVRLDMAVVFGHRVLATGESGVVMRDRTLAAVALWKAGQVRYIMVSGSIDETPAGLRSEALAMKQVCLGEGVPPEAIIVDETGVNTRATVANTRKTMAGLGLKSIVATSSDYHLLRIRTAYRAVGIDAYTVSSRPTEWTQAEPFAVAREMVGLAVYKLFPRYREAH